MVDPLVYPIGEQNFKFLRETGCLYIDKTSYIKKIISPGSKYYFLARPRRFGKSLFLSTLRYFFEGERNLFHGLSIDSLNWDWLPYAVLRIDLNVERYDEPGKLETVLSNLFNEWEEKYEVAFKAEDLSSRFRNIIKTVHEKTGRPVVILVDEYDKPLVSNLDKEDLYEHYRARLSTVYSNFKSSAEHIRLVFLTGVSRFSKLSIFSDLNNLNDITFDNEFADICGITEQELRDNLQIGIEAFAQKRHMSFDVALDELKKNYDGYRFAEEGSDIYNPWSLLCCLSKKTIANYWNQTGIPTLLGEALKRVDANLEEILNTKCDIDTLVGMDLTSPNPLALLYQTGYLTIKHYDDQTQFFTLGVPNREVKEGLAKSLLPYYVTIKRGVTEGIASELIKDIQLGEPYKLMKNLQIYFAGIPYELKMDNENNFQNAFYILLTLIGVKAHAEVSTSDGRIDILIETPNYVYIIELKYDGTPQEALKQIDDKQYARPYLTDHRTIFKIGVNFSSKTRCIEDFAITETINK